MATDIVKQMIAKYSKQSSKSGGRTCDQLLRGAEAKEARAEKLARANAPKAAAAEAAAKKEYERDLKRAEEEAKREAQAAGVAFSCAAKPAKRRSSKTMSAVAAAAAPRKARKKAPKRAAKKASTKKTNKRGAAKKTAKRGGKKAAKREPRRDPGTNLLSLPKKVDRELLNKAIKAVEGRGDGRISMDDARKMMHSVVDDKDRNEYTDAEKATMKYIRKTFKFTDEADEWMRHQIAGHGARQAHRAQGHKVKTPKAPKAKRAAKKKAGKKAAKKVAKRAAKAAKPKKQAKKVGPVIIAQGPVIVESDDDAKDQALMGGLGASVKKAMQEMGLGDGAANEGLPRRGRREVVEGCPSPSRAHTSSGY